MNTTPEAAFSAQNLRRWLIPAGLFLVVVALYGQFLWNPIVFDDIYFFLVDASGHMPVMDIQYRPYELRSLPYASLAWTLSFFGNALIYYRWGNLLLHAAVVLAVYGCAVSLRVLYSGGRTASHLDRTIAGAAALLFALHPVGVFATAYLVQRSILMATLFSIAAIWAFAWGGARQQPRYQWLALVFYYFAVFSKEHAIMLVAVFPLLTIALHLEWRARVRRELPMLCAAAALAVCVLYMSRHQVGEVYETDGASLALQWNITHPLLTSVLTQMRMFFHYVGLWLFPNVAWMSIDMRVPFAHSIFSEYGISALAYLCWGGVGLHLLLGRGRYQWAGPLMLFPWLMGWTELVSVRLQEPFVLYRSYIWAAGATCFAATCPVPRWDRRAWAGVGVLALVFFGLSMERLQTFSHAFLVWDDAQRALAGHTDLPGAGRIYYNRGTQYLNLQKWPEAQQDLQTATQLQPNFAPAFGNLGVAYLRQSAWAASAEAFGRAAELDRVAGKPPQERYYLGRAQALEKIQPPAPAR